MTPPNFPVKYSDLGARIVYASGCPEQFEIGSVTIIPIRINHPNGGSGYKFVEDGNTFVFLTDNELGFMHPGGLETSEYLEFCADVDLLFHDAEYTPQEYGMTMDWGHSVFTDVVDMAIKANVKKLGLFHMNQARTDDDQDLMVEECKKIITESNSDLECFAVGTDMVFELPEPVFL